MTRLRPALLLVAFAVSLGLLAPHAFAHSSSQEAVEVVPGTGFQALRSVAGQRTVVRRGAGVRVSRQRTKRRRSVAFFGQLSDLHIADEESPARKEYLASDGDPSNRPQEALRPQAANELIRALDRERRSRHRTGRGRRAHRLLTLVTGDLTDNGQFNEALQFRALMLGGRVSPDSGVRGRCPAGDRVAGGRLYTGVQRWRDYPRGVTIARKANYWDPDLGRSSGRYGALRYPGLMDRAQWPFTAHGLSGRWYVAPGNHDDLRQGFASGDHPAFDDAMATGCSKPFPSDSFGPQQLNAFTDRQALQRLAAPDVLAALRRDSQQVPGDPDRRMVGKPELRRLLKGRWGGYGRVAVKQRRKSANSASFYAFSPRKRLRFISLDTSSDGGESGGNLDDPQYRWLERELDRASSVRLDGRGRVHRDRDRDRLIVVFGHHRLEDMYNRDPDELAPCRSVPPAGCDSDPRDSRPIHTGLAGQGAVARLLRRYPNVIAYLGGHAHKHFVAPHFRRDRKGGFWEIATAGGADFPAQARTIDVMDNRDDTLSLLSDLVGSDAPLQAPASGTSAASLTDRNLASLSRALAANGRIARFAIAASGDAEDRNVELVLRNPARLYAEATRRR